MTGLGWVRPGVSHGAGFRTLIRARGLAALGGLVAAEGERDRGDRGEGTMTRLGF